MLRNTNALRSVLFLCFQQNRLTWFSLDWNGNLELIHSRLLPAKPNLYFSSSSLFARRVACTKNVEAKTVLGSCLFYRTRTKHNEFIVLHRFNTDSFINFFVCLLNVSMNGTVCPRMLLTVTRRVISLITFLILKCVSTFEILTKQFWSQGWQYVKNKIK